MTIYSFFNPDETFSGIRRGDNPGWAGWKIVDRYKGLYKDFPPAVFENALQGDALLKEYVRDFYGTDRSVGTTIQSEGGKPAGKTRKRNRR